MWLVIQFRLLQVFCFHCCKITYCIINVFLTDLNIFSVMQRKWPKPILNKASVRHLKKNKKNLITVFPCQRGRREFLSCVQFVNGPRSIRNVDDVKRWTYTTHCFVTGQTSYKCVRRKTRAYTAIVVFGWSTWDCLNIFFGSNFLVETVPSWQKEETRWTTWLNFWIATSHHRWPSSWLTGR